MSGKLKSCADCKEKDVDEFADWTCKNCEDMTYERVPPELEEVAELHEIIRAGYTVERDDLPYWKWRLLGIYNKAARQVEAKELALEIAKGLRMR